MTPKHKPRTGGNTKPIKSAKKVKQPSKPAAKETVTAAPRPASAKVRITKPIVFLIGDRALVDEYAALCVSHQYDVVAVPNDSEEQTAHSRRPTVRTTIKIPPNVSVALELTNLDPAVKRANLEQIDAALPPTAPILSTSITVTATEQATWLTHRHRLVGIGVLPSFADRPLIETAGTIYSPKETFAAAGTFLASIGKEMQLVDDRIGMVMPRIICQIINEAAFALQEEVAVPQDIDAAMKLGANYPFGPIEWAERIGLRQVAAVIMALHHDLGEERYRPAPLLRQFAVTGHWWKR